MLGMRRGEVLNLVAATGAGSHQDGSCGLCFDFIDEWLGHLQREVVLRFESAESAGHTATTGFEQGDLSLW